MRTLTGLCLLLSTAARAEGPRVAILPPQLEGAASDPRAKADRDNLVAYVAEALGALGYTMVDDQAVATMMESDAGLKGCIARPDCKVKLLDRLNAQLLVTMTANRPPTGVGAWSVTVAAYAADTRRMGASDLRACEKCDVAALHAPVVELVGKVLADEKRRGRAKLIVRPKPETSIVFVSRDKTNFDEVGRGEVRLTIYGDDAVVKVEGGGTSQTIDLEQTPDRTHVIEVDLSTERSRTTTSPTRSGARRGCARSASRRWRRGWSRSASASP